MPRTLKRTRPHSTSSLPTFHSFRLVRDQPMPLCALGRGGATPRLCPTQPTVQFGKTATGDDVGLLIRRGVVSRDASIPVRSSRRIEMPQSCFPSGLCIVHYPRSVVDSIF
jgi:hypothetical protein